MTENRTPRHLWLVGIIALLFNSMGIFDYLMTMTQGSAYLANAGMTPEQITHYEAYPTWMTAIWAIGVWGAFTASILLLLRKRQASLAFAIGLAAFLISLLYTYVLTEGGDILGASNMIISAVITVMLILFLIYSNAMARRGVLR